REASGAASASRAGTAACRGWGSSASRARPPFGSRGGAARPAAPTKWWPRSCLRLRVLAGFVDGHVLGAIDQLADPGIVEPELSCRLASLQMGPEPAAGYDLRARPNTAAPDKFTESWFGRVEESGEFAGSRGVVHKRLPSMDGLQPRHDSS